MTAFAPRVVVPVLLLLLTCAGCTRGADESRLRDDLQARLDRDVKADLFDVTGIRREGSAPLPVGESGAARVVVYFNATLTLAEDYTFGGRDQLAGSSLAFALGANEKGVFGLRPENRAGDVVRAYGSATYEQSADGTWTSVGAAPAQASSGPPNIEGSAPPSRSKQLIDRLAGMVNLPPPGVNPQQDEIIAEELERASENIERRVRRREHTFTLASGPKDGEYTRFFDSLVATLNQEAPAVKLRQRTSEGSVDNAWLLSRGEADYAIVQADVAAAALAGEHVFARGGPLTNLRAIGGLFPEAIHIVVLADSPIKTVGDLRGLRVDAGAPQSGTQFDATAVLAAHGLKEQDLREVRTQGFTVALPQLQRRQIDAVFVTSAAPVRALQQLATGPGIRLLPIEGAALERLVRSRPGLAPLTLPVNTYPRQRHPVTTAASAALLLTTADAPAGEVEQVADLVFSRMPRQFAGSANVLNLSAENELRGITVPLHPGAGRRTRDRPASTSGAQ